MSLPSILLQPFLISWTFLLLIRHQPYNSISKLCKIEKCFNVGQMSPHTSFLCRDTEITHIIRLYSMMLVMIWAFNCYEARPAKSRSTAWCLGVEKSLLCWPINIFSPRRVQNSHKTNIEIIDAVRVSICNALWNEKLNEEKVRKYSKPVSVLLYIPVLQTHFFRNTQIGMLY